MLLFLVNVLAVGCIRPDSQHLRQHVFTTVNGPATISDIPKQVSKYSLVSNILRLADVVETSSFLTKMTTFPDRYFKSNNGVAAATWIYDQVLGLKGSLDSEVLLTVKFFNHSWRRQPSVLARLESRLNTAADIVITGSHLDTIAYGSFRPEPNANPGADDCASGSSVVFETLRVLVSSGFVPKRPIEFHWYAGEEEGVYGSNEVANAYAKAGINVLTYLNLDQTGYVRPGSTPHVGMLTDYASPDSTNFLAQVAKAYSLEPIATARCGYACTDNSAWDSHGYKAASLMEGKKEDFFPYNDRVKVNGDPLDTLDVINWEHLMEFVKVTIGFVVELSLAE